MEKKPQLNALIPEFLCTNLKVSLAFYIDVLGFRILFQREENNFAMLEREGAQIMLDELVSGSPRSWLAGPLEAPFGRGLNLDIQAKDVEAFYAHVQSAGARIFLPIEEKWYRADAILLGCRQFVVLDPDGYLLRFSEGIGTQCVCA